MKAILFCSVLLSTLSANAFALNKYDAKTLSCEQVQEIVQNEGAVILKSGWSSNIFVSNPNICLKNRAEAFPAYTSTADKSFCFAGYDCRKKRRGGHGHEGRN